MVPVAINVYIWQVTEHNSSGILVSSNPVAQPTFMMSLSDLQAY